MPPIMAPILSDAIKHGRTVLITKCIVIHGVFLVYRIILRVMKCTKNRRRCPFNWHSNYLIYCYFGELVSGKWLQAWLHIMQTPAQLPVSQFQACFDFNIE